MKSLESMTNKVAYGRKLANAGLTGIRTGQETAFLDQSFSALVIDSLPDSLTLAAVGACIGILRPCLTRRHNRLPRALAGGVVGSALGLCAGFAWKTRAATSGIVHSARKEMDRVRDEHWLEMNPITYA